jgi:hypothetical protein
MQYRFEGIQLFEKALLIPQSVTDGLAHFLTSLSESIIYFDFSAFTAIHVYQI